MRFLFFLALFVLVLSAYGQLPPTIDGYTYKTVKIGEQEWFAENLKTTVYANGEEIPYSRTDESWTTQEMGMRCLYNHDDAMNAKYGQLYNGYAVDDVRGLCPVGWHVPTDGEWTELEIYIGLEGFGGTEGTALKSTAGWPSNGNGTDDFGFSALPGGGRFSDLGGFGSAGNGGYWWSSSPGGGCAWVRYLSGKNPDVTRYNGSPRSGFSVRCLKD